MKIYRSGLFGMKVGLIIILIGFITLSITWYLHENEYNNLNPVEGNEIKNTEEFKNGDIAYIYGKDMGSGEYADGPSYINIDTYYEKYESDDFDKINITYLPIYFDKPIDPHGGPDDIVIKVKIIDNGENRSIEGLELYNSYKLIYRTFITIEIIVLLIGLIILLSFFIQFQRKLPKVENIKN